MNRLALVLALAGCAFSQKHPAVTAAITGAVVGGLACEIDSPAEQSTCGIIAGGAAVFLGGITALVTLFADPSDHELPPPSDEEEDEAGRPHVAAAPADRDRRGRRRWRRELIAPLRR